MRLFLGSLGSGRIGLVGVGVRWLVVEGMMAMLMDM